VPFQPRCGPAPPVRNEAKYRYPHPTQSRSRHCNLQAPRSPATAKPPRRRPARRAQSGPCSHWEPFPRAASDHPQGVRGGPLGCRPPRCRRAPPVRNEANSPGFNRLATPCLPPAQQKAPRSRAAAKPPRRRPARRAIGARGSTKRAATWAKRMPSSPSSILRSCIRWRACAPCVPRLRTYTGAGVDPSAPCGQPLCPPSHDKAR
jgi:hypothetical protein